jgi:hypothetical protein
MNKWLLASALGLMAVPAQATIIYSNDFDGSETLAAGVTATIAGGSDGHATTGAWNANGWSGLFLSNRTLGNPAAQTTITLSGLLPNSAVVVTGIIGLLDSWDSNSGSGFAPDYLDFYINGSLVASMTTNTALGPIEDLQGATKLFSNVNVDSDSTYYSDVLADLSSAAFLTSAADGSGVFTLAIGASGGGWQGGTDEGWGLDSLSVEGTAAPLAAVPEPASWALMIAGFGLIGAGLRRRTGTLALA